MVPNRISILAVALLAISAVLLVNPFYLQDDDRGDQFTQIERVSPA